MGIGVVDCLMVGDNFFDLVVLCRNGCDIVWCVYLNFIFVFVSNSCDWIFW